MEKWVETKNLKVVRGAVTLDIGDEIIYHDCAGENGTDLYKGTWQVLGADKDGNLLIVSKDNVAIHHFNAETLDDAKEAYSNGAKTLDELCEIYSSGNGAIKSRSIRIEDVDKITGYGRTTYPDYGKDFTYKNRTKNTFIWHDGNNWCSTNSKKDIILTNSYYGYSASRNTGLERDGKAYNMLFGNNDKSYWLASPYVATDASNATFGLRRVYSGYVGRYYFVDSRGYYHGATNGVRAVVTLKSNIPIT